MCIAHYVNKQETYFVCVAHIQRKPWSMLASISKKYYNILIKILHTFFASFSVKMIRDTLPTYLD